MTDTPRAGRPNQKRRTRKDLLEAASRLMKRGRKPSLEEIAEQALVSRATAYRYFPSVETLLLEASLDVATPSAEEIFRGQPGGDAVSRLVRADVALHEMILANETPLRMMLAQALERSALADADADLPPRQNRRSPLIEAALEPARGEFAPELFETLGQALALVLGTESLLVFKDVLQLDDARTREVKRWTIEALVAAARKTGAA